MVPEVLTHGKMAMAKQLSLTDGRAARLMNVSLVQTWPVLETGFRHSPHLIVLLEKSKRCSAVGEFRSEMKAPKSNLLRDRAVCTVGP